MKKLITGLLALAMIMVTGVELAAATDSAEAFAGGSVAARNFTDLTLKSGPMGTIENYVGSYQDLLTSCIDNNDPDGFRVRFDASQTAFVNPAGSQGDPAYSIEYDLYYDYAAQGGLGADADDAAAFNFDAGAVNFDFDTNVVHASNDGTAATASDCSTGLEIDLDIQFNAAEVADLLAGTLSETIIQELGDL